MELHKWVLQSEPILFGNRNILILRSLVVQANGYNGQSISVPLYRDSRPIFVAGDSSLPPGYDLVYDYKNGILQIYKYDAVSGDWQLANSIPHDLNVQVFMIYELISRGG